MRFIIIISIAVIATALTVNTFSAKHSHQEAAEQTSNTVRLAKAHAVQVELLSNAVFALNERLSANEANLHALINTVGPKIVAMHVYLTKLAQERPYSNSFSVSFSEDDDAFLTRSTPARRQSAPRPISKWFRSAP